MRHQTLPMLGALMSPLYRIIAGVQRLGFWLAVILPFVYLPLLAIKPYIESFPLLLLAAVSLNVLSLVIGHGYDPRMNF